MELKRGGYESSWRSACPILHATEIQRLLENMASNIFVWELLHCCGNFLKLILFIFHEIHQEIGSPNNRRREDNQLVCDRTTSMGSIIRSDILSIDMLNWLD